MGSRQRNPSVVWAPLLLAGLASCNVVLDFSEDLPDGHVFSDALIARVDAGGSCPSPTTFYADADGDGFGDPAAPVTACAQPAGTVEDDLDCDDGWEAAHPGGTEACDGHDDDCNGTVDDGACQAGCADGQREGFLASTHLRIAACSGGWSIGGVQLDEAPACGRAGGDDGANPNGTGCRAVDLCAGGWHVCASPADVSSSSGTGGCVGMLEGASSLTPMFFVTRQSGSGAASCDLAGSNDLFGCGTLGAAPAATCAPLDRFSGDLCSLLGAPWDCGADGAVEALNVSKGSPAGGGVLCCRAP